MEKSQEATLLRLFVGEQDRDGHQPLYETILLKAREHGLSGATVLRGVAGYGRTSTLHTAKILRLSEDLPMVVEIVDTNDRIESFLSVLEEMMYTGMYTVETVSMRRYGVPAEG
jgi:PII-like signaling protein